MKKILLLLWIIMLLYSCSNTTNDKKITDNHEKQEQKLDNFKDTTIINLDNNSVVDWGVKQWWHLNENVMIEKWNLDF